MRHVLADHRQPEGGVPATVEPAKRFGELGTEQSDTMCVPVPVTFTPINDTAN